MEERYESRDRSRSPAGDRPSNDEGKLFVGNLGFETTNEELADAFGRYGKVSDARVIFDRNTGRSKGFGFVTFENADDATEALNGMQGAELQGRPIRVDRTNSNGGDRGGRSFGGGGRFGGDRGGRFGGDRGDRFGGDRFSRDRRDGGDRFGGRGGDDRRGGRGGFDGGRGRGGPAGPCYANQRGECRYGDSCRFSHSM